MNTFNDVESSDNGKSGRKKSDVAILGVPFDMGTTGNAGQRTAPYHVREAGFWPDGMRHVLLGVDPIEALTIVDVGNVEVTPGDPAGAWKAMREEAARVYTNTHCLVTIGGDHSCTAKIAQGIVDVEKDPLTIFVFDAHTDYWRPDAGVELNHGSWVRHTLENGVANRVVQFGVRGWGVSQQEAHWAEKNDITTYYATTTGWMEKLREEIVDSSDPIYLSIDMDVLDPSFAPGVAFQEPGGITVRELFAAIQTVASSGKLVAADIMETVPSLDPTGITVKTANRCVAQLVTGLACSRGA